ncbi:hypothetical protein [Halorubellus sp. PRR65]|uniref:DUF7555 family protein n=1 Tax=Halorubellus sp. PRR65 TaxID=3098148 RepID=UPI002B25C648|nr:hypothetical protein [Halorubellus sp. PRR65]
MSASSSKGVSPDAVEAFALKVVDLATYVVVLLAVVFAPLSIVEWTVFGGLVFTKWLTFVVGAAVVAYASLKLRPDSPKKRAASVDAGASQPTVGNVEVSVVQRVAAAVPPARWTALSVGERFSPNVKRFVGGVAIAGASMAMEFVFGIGLGA